MRLQFFRKDAAATAIASLAFVLTCSAQSSLNQLSELIQTIKQEYHIALSDAPKTNALLRDMNLACLAFQQARVSNHDDPELERIYFELDQILREIVEHYDRAGRDCVSTAQTNTICDSAKRGRLGALKAVATLNLDAASLFSQKDPARSKLLLESAKSTFGVLEQTASEADLRAEYLLERSYSEDAIAQLSAKDSAAATREYIDEISDLKSIMDSGTNSRQCDAAQKGLVRAYHALQLISDAKVPPPPSNSRSMGQERFQIQTAYAAMYATTDSSKRAEYKRFIANVARRVANNPGRWCRAIAAIAKYSRDPMSEFSDSADPFVSRLLASVLIFKKSESRTNRCASPDIPDDCS